LKINLLAPDIYEIENFLTFEENEEFLKYCKNLDESDWWVKDRKAALLDYFDGRTIFWDKESPELFKNLNKKIEICFSGYLDLVKPQLYRNLKTHSIGEHRDNDIGFHKSKNYHTRYGIVVYFNDDYTGGEIYYPNHKLYHKPKSRSLILHGGNILHGTTEVSSDSIRYFSTSFVRGNELNPVILNKEMFANLEESDGSKYF
jgi:hypothetical protein